jgi:type IV secretory pathway TraG/TraD family ATPase VirD4
MTKPTEKIISVPATPSYLDQSLIFLKSERGSMVMVVGVILLVLMFLGNDKRGKLAGGFLGGKKQWNQAKGISLKTQVRPFTSETKKANTPAPTRNSCSLWINTPKDYREGWNKLFASRMSNFVAPKDNNAETLYFPDAQTSFSIIGGSGTGKTFSTLDPFIGSVIDQGFPVLVYDFKWPNQGKRHIANAIARGYKVYVFAPGRPESFTMNILDFLKDEEDAVAAGQLAQVIVKNSSIGTGDDDPFFGPAGTTLVTGLFLAAKWLAKELDRPDIADLMMCQAILNLPDLGIRLGEAMERMNVWTFLPLAQVVSVKDSPDTISGIIATAQKIFAKFLQKDFIGAFCGNSDLPIDIDGKTMLVFGLDRSNRDIAGPLLAAIMHMVVSRNVSREVPRKDPLIVALDELPSLFLPQLPNWLNENREDGFVGLLGYQNMAQIEKSYGKETARFIFGGTATKIIFNPRDGESAKLFAEYIGERDVEFKSKSKSVGGGKNGASTSTADNLQKTWLIEPAQFNKLSRGKAVVISPSFTHKDEEYIPLIHKFKISKADIANRAWAGNRWDEHIRPRYIEKQRGKADGDALSKQMLERTQIALEAFPMPGKKGDSKLNARSTPAIDADDLAAF